MGKKYFKFTVTATALGLICIISSLWWLPYEQNATNSQDILFNDPDSTYQLHRIVGCTEHYPYVSSFDRFSHYPAGNRVHWPNAYSSTLASLSKIFGIHGNHEQIAFLSWIPVGLGILAILSVLFLLLENGTPPTFLLALIPFLLFAPECTMNFYYGNIDHHGIMQFSFFLLIFQFWNYKKWIYGTGLFIALFFTPESLLFVTFFMFLGQLTYFFSAEPEKHLLGVFLKTPILFFYPFLIALASYLLHWVLQYEVSPFFSLDPTIQSFFQPLWFLSLGICCFLISKNFIHSTKNSLILSLKSNLPLILVVMSSFFTVWFICFSYNGILDLFINRMVSSSRIYVSEESSPLFFPTFSTSFLHFKLYIIFILLSLFKLHQSAYKNHKWMIIFLVLLVGVLEFRSLRTISLVAFLGLTMMLQTFTSKVPRKRWQKCLFFVCIISSLSIIYGSIYALAPARNLSDIDFKFRQANREIILCKEKDIFTKGGGILGPWSLGHHLNHFLDSGVTVDPFNFPTPIKPVLDFVLKETNTTKYLENLEKLDIRYLFYFLPDQEFRVVMKSHEKRKHLKYFRNTQGHVFIYSKFFQDYPFMRAAHDINFANFVLGLKIKYYSNMWEFYLEDIRGELLINKRPLVQVYEKGPSAKITGKIPGETPFLTIHYTLLFESGESRSMEYPIELGPDGEFCFEVANPAPYTTPGLFITGPYVLQAGDLVYCLSVSEKDIRSPHSIEINWTLD